MDPRFACRFIDSCQHLGGPQTSKPVEVRKSIVTDSDPVRVLAPARVARGEEISVDQRGRHDPRLPRHRPEPSSYVDVSRLFGTHHSAFSDQRVRLSSLRG
ncbi:hypothetical protein ACRAKI_32945 [Saccharothrix isguenensis]